MAIAKAKIVATDQPEMLFPYGTEITIEIRGEGISAHLDDFSLKLWHIGLTPIQWTVVRKLEMQNE